MSVATLCTAMPAWTSWRCCHQMSLAVRHDLDVTQEVIELFTIGASTKLYALAEDFSTEKPAVEFLHLSTSTGAITKLLTLKEPANGTCYSTAIRSATRIYSVCQSFTSSKPTSGKVICVSRPALCRACIKSHYRASSIAHVAHVSGQRHRELRPPLWSLQLLTSKRCPASAWLGEGLAMRFVTLRSCLAADIPVQEGQGTQGGRVPAQGPDSCCRHSPVKVRMLSHQFCATQCSRVRRTGPRPAAGTDLEAMSFACYDLWHSTVRCLQ